MMLLHLITRRADLVSDVSKPKFFFSGSLNIVGEATPTTLKTASHSSSECGNEVAAYSKTMAGLASSNAVTSGDGGDTTWKHTEVSRGSHWLARGGAGAVSQVTSC